jgi:hypothetical protein
MSHYVVSAVFRVFSERSMTFRENIFMAEETSLLPPVRVIHDHLTRNQRERRRLRTLLRLAIEVDNERRRQPPPAPQPEAARPGGEA